mgnify:CR=1 FL=1
MKVLTISGENLFYAFIEILGHYIPTRDPKVLEYDEKKLHLIHGDGLAPGDGGYRFLKKILRNRYSLRIFLWVLSDAVCFLQKLGIPLGGLA